MKFKFLMLCTGIIILNTSLDAASTSKLTAFLKKGTLESQSTYQNRLRALATAIMWEIPRHNPDIASNVACGQYVVAANSTIESFIFSAVKTVEPVLKEIVDDEPGMVGEEEILAYYNDVYQKIIMLLPKNSKIFGSEKIGLPKFLQFQLSNK